MAELTLEQRIERMEAVHQVMNLLGRMEFWHVANLHRKCLQLWALDTPGVRVEMDWGIFEGREGVERFYLGYHARNEAENDSPRNGEMHLHTLTTPVIEVADDLQTASGVMISPGLESGNISPTGQRGEIEAFWLWNKYGFECIKENGKWKIWHLRVYNTFICPYYKSWVDVGDLPPRPGMPDEIAPDRYLPQPPPWRYGVDRPHVNVPPPPEPYANYEELKKQLSLE